jgi:hypothetical protein
MIGLSDILRPGMIQAQASHPQAAKCVFSNHTNSLAMIGEYLTSVRYRT